MRASMAGLVDGLLWWATFFGSVLSLIALLEGPGSIVAAVLVLPVATVITVNSILLPRWVHASIGDLIFGLVKIRPGDGGRPSVSDLARNIWNPKPSRGDSATPRVVQVRRCDTVRWATTSENSPR
ncbi:hypothetical protein [Nocardia neocaledoniensis]|uniref:hypothetical protein n=1 Tax=Nocardia neocaledoniensis TaxID=236511 RepID=UPI002457E03F|nr:hypothetical protein [Nocardia neocaledoniensis]